jgi:proton-dependent oligopeptide transporter, POT family
MNKNTTHLLSEKQPQGLYLLFTTGIWERFGFYTLQAIIILYMSKSLILSDHRAYLLYAVFNALLYVTPILGGYLADHYLGFKRSIVIGGFLLTLGYMVIAINNIHAFFWGLSIIICANGLFKPSISSIIGCLYNKDDPRRDSGFTIFYMGINIGSMFPPLMAGLIVRKYGWHAGFLVAALGMLVGFLIFVLWKKRLGHHGEAPSSSPLQKSRVARLKFDALFYPGLILSVILFYTIFMFPDQAGWLLNFSAVVVVLVVLWFLFKESAVWRSKMTASLILILISIGFWALYNQTFMSLMLFSDRNLNKNLLGLNLTPEMIQFFNPFFIILISPFLSYLWIKLARFRKDPSIPMKFALGVLFMSSGFLLLGIATYYCQNGGYVSIWWLILSFFLQTIGELLISPIGLSMITVLSPPRLVGMMMGVWFFAQAEAAELAGYLAKIAAVPKMASTSLSLHIYGHAFLIYGAVTLILSVIAFACVPFLKKMIM